MMAPRWATHRLTQWGNDELFWWGNSNQIQPVSEGKVYDLVPLDSGEFNNYLAGEYGVVAKPITRGFENK